MLRNKIAFGGHGSLAHRLRTMLENRGLGDIAQQGSLVGLEPAAELHNYEDYPFWDIGVLWMTQEKLYYLGEQTEFALARDQVHGVSTGDARPEWLSEKNIRLQWQSNPQVKKSSLYFVAVGESSVLKARRAIGVLHKRLEGWLNQSEKLPLRGSNLESIVEPSFPPITSTPAETAFKPPDVLMAALKFSGYGAVISFALGLPLSGIFYVLIVVVPDDAA